MDIDIHEVLEAVGGQPVGEWKVDRPVRGVSTDTRTVQKDDLFFALKGARLDGHDFLEEALGKGAGHAAIRGGRIVKSEWRDRANFIAVADTLAAYGDLARFYRRKFKVPVIAITGSSGKTTVKEMTAHVLAAKFSVLKNRGTENNLIGVPKTIFQCDGTHEVLVLEMGTNRPGEIERLSDIAAPQVGIVTQIAAAHLEGLGSLEGVKQEKLGLLRHIDRGGILILNGQDPMLRDVQSGMHRVVRVGLTREGNDFWAERVWCHEKGCSFLLNGKDLFETRLIGRHNVLNGLFAAAAAVSLGLEMSAIQKQIASFEPVAGRLEAKTIEGIHFIDDSYNANPDSFKAALETLKGFKIREKKIVVCGDMLELGGQSDRLHRELGAFMAGFLFDHIIAAGPESRHLVKAVLEEGFDPKRTHHAKDSEEAGRICRQIAAPGDMVLVKGSRGMRMEKVLKAFG